MRRNIWIVNYYTPPPEYVRHPRHIELAKSLIKEGYDVMIISAGYLSKNDIELVPEGKKYYETVYDGIKYIHIKVKHYQGRGLSRMFSIFQFAVRTVLYRKRFGTPDIIYHTIYAPFDYPITLMSKCSHFKYIAEAWDLWPNAFERKGLVGHNNPILRMAYGVERNMYNAASAVIFSMEGGVDYLRSRGWTKDCDGKIDQSKVHYINNGIDIKKFYQDKEQNILNDDDINNPNTFKIVFLGSIRREDNFKVFINAAKLLSVDERFRFLVYGDGNCRDEMEEYCGLNDINNVIFKDRWLPFKYAPYVLSHSTVNVMCYLRSFATYGASSGKMFLYFSAGRPICCNVKMNYCQIEKNNLGIAQYLDTPQEFADAIMTLATMTEEEQKSMQTRMKAVAEEFDFDVLSHKIINIIESVS